MIDCLSRKVDAGDLYVNLARRHLANHEWGNARIAIEKGIAKGRLSNPRQASELLHDICFRLGINPVSATASEAPDQFRRG